MAKYLLLSFTVIGLFLGGLIYKSQNPTTTQAYQNPSTKNVLHSKQETHIKKEKAKLAVNKELQLANTQKQPIKNLDTPKIESTTQPENNIEESYVTPEEIEESLKHANSFSIWLNNATKASKDFSLREHMDIRFNSEPLDSHWATEQESKLQNIFYNDETLSDLALKEVSCRSTQCIISVHITDIEQANGIIALVSDAIDEKGKFYNIVATPDESTGETRLYIKDNDQSFYAHTEHKQQSLQHSLQQPQP